MFKRGFWLSMPSILLAFSCLLLMGNALSPQAGGTAQQQAYAAPSCKSSATPDAHSLLVVLLDRSSSLAQTDPQEYSISITRMLANLWPGEMAVLFFSGTSPQLPQLGPVSLDQPGVRINLQAEIEAQKNVLQPDTPTRYAVEQASSLLAHQGYPQGSEVMLITDGQPFLPDDQQGLQQVSAIEQTDAPVFCARGVPINTVGLGNQVPASAQTFLRQVASDTRGTYQDVTDPAQLAAPVLQLYAGWQHIKFVSTGKSHQFLVDTYARQVDFIAFLSNSQTFPVTLLGPDHQPLPVQDLVSQTQDIHYQFDQMVTQQFNTAGTYTVQTADPGAQTYVLEETRLQVEILSPAPHTALYAGRPLTVSVALFDNNNPQQHIYPASSASVTIGLTYTLQKNGHIIVSGEKTLLQQPAPNDDIFSTQLTLPSAGTLTLSISASYQYVPISASPRLTVQVSDAPAGPAGWLILLVVCFLVAVVLALLLFVTWGRPVPSGFLEDARKQGEGQALGQGRSLGNRVLHRSTLSSAELSGFDFQEAHFHLHFKRGQRVFLATDPNAASLAVWCIQKPAGEQMQPVRVGLPVLLHDRDRLLVNGFPCATFHAEARFSLRETGQSANSQATPD